MAILHGLPDEDMAQTRTNGRFHVPGELTRRSLGSGVVERLSPDLEPVPVMAPWPHEPAIMSRRDDTLRPATGRLQRAERWDAEADAVLFEGPCEDLLASMPDGSASLVVTSPPYNIGKSYERRTSLDRYLEAQERVIIDAVRVLADGGSICWQVGNHVDRGEIFPLDALLYPIFKRLGLRLRNRVIWHFEHGLHASKRFSGRHEAILWFTKGDDYYFDLDTVRVPQKYPNKRAFKGPNRGELTGNPLGKNPGDVWVIPNVKWNHVEKTAHPCQFPVELIERLVLPLTRPGDLVVDPYGGVGSAVLAAVLNGRRGAMAEIVPEYVAIARERLDLAERGELRTRPMARAVYRPRP
jgi:adenine-specific DNA-methyltransferase